MMHKAIVPKQIGKMFSRLSNSFSLDQIKNLNLKFDTPEWSVNLYPFYPQVYKKKSKSNIYEISNNSIVLAITFLNKVVQGQVAWQNRKSTTLRFKELGMLMAVAPMSGAKVEIQGGNTNAVNGEKLKIFKLQDVPEKQNVILSLSSYIDNSSSEGLSKMQGKQQVWSITTHMHYSEYRILYKLLQNSLLDLSGWRLMMELQKRQQLAKVEGKVHDAKQMDELLKN